jgi:excisionase family DNA binding protein
MKKANSESMYLTVRDVSAYLNLSQSKAYELTHRKDFPVCRFGGAVRIPKDAFMKWVEQQTYVPANIVA